VNLVTQTLISDELQNICYFKVFTGKHSELMISILKHTTQD